jgi:hypothetical protein
MPVSQIGTLTDFVPGTPILSAEVDGNFDAVKTAFNALVTATDTLGIDTINESTLNNGVLIDGVRLKDGGVVAAGAISGVTTLAMSGTATIGGNVSAVDGAFSGNVTVTGTLTAGSIVGSMDLTDGVTLTGYAAPEGILDARYNHGVLAADSPYVAHQVYARYDEGGTTTTGYLAGGFSMAALRAATRRAGGTLASTDAGTGIGVIGAASGARTHIGVVGHGLHTNTSGGSMYTYGTYGLAESDAAVSSPVTLAGLVGFATGKGAILYSILGKAPTSTDFTTMATLYVEDPSSGDTILAASGAKLTTAGVWTDASSAERKQNVRPIAELDVRTALAALEPRRFDRMVDDVGSRVQPDIGFIAEDVPTLVADPARTGIAPGRIATVAVAGWQLHEAEIQDLKARVTALEGGVTP